jgi:hypothetical protein
MISPSVDDRSNSLLSLPEILGALSMHVRTAQSDIVEHAVVELLQQVSASRSFLPLRDLLQQLWQ